GRSIPHLQLSGSGTSIEQTKPSGRNSRRTVAPGIAFSIKEVPRPTASGDLTAGPAFSCHTSIIARRLFRELTVQLTVMIPAGRDREPYFAALVASSCKTRLNGVARSAGSDSGSPATRKRSGLADV